MNSFRELALDCLKNVNEIPELRWDLKLYPIDRTASINIAGTAANEYLLKNRPMAAGQVFDSLKETALSALADLKQFRSKNVIADYDYDTVVDLYGEALENCSWTAVELVALVRLLWVEKRHLA